MEGVSKQQATARPGYDREHPHIQKSEVFSRENRFSTDNGENKKRQRGKQHNGGRTCKEGIITRNQKRKRTNTNEIINTQSRKGEKR